MKKIVYALILNVLSWSLAVQADDIDIYIQESATSVPLLMLSLDFSSNLTSTLSRYNQAEELFTEKAWEKLRLARGAELNDDGELIPGEDEDTSTAVNRLEAFTAVLEAVIDTDKLKTNEDGTVVLDDEGNPIVVLDADGNPIGLYDAVYLGLMLPNKGQAPGKPDVDGGNIIEGYKNIGEHEAELLATLRSIDPDTPANEMHKFQLKETFMEWYRYLNAGEVIFGNNVSTADNFGGFISRPAPVGTSPDNKTHVYGPEADQDIFLDTDSFQSHYKDPLPEGFECPKLFAIVMSMEGSDPGQDSALDDVINTEMSDQITTAPDMLEYLHGNNLIGGVEDTALRTWVITDLNNSGNTRGDVGELAVAGGGSDEALDISDPAALEVALGEIFNDVIEVSSTFVASSVPVNVFNRSESLDNLFVALFEARATVNWPGNLKKLKLNDVDGDNVFDEILDALDNEAFETSGDNAGRIKQGALTYWTLSDELDDSFKANIGTGDPVIADGEPVQKRGENGELVFEEDGITPVYYEATETVRVDGREVARGGSGQIIPGYIDSDDTRYLYLEPISGSDLIPFETIGSSPDTEEVDRINNLLGVTYSSLGDADQSAALDEADQLINWAHGFDTDEDGELVKRSWMMGASIHSQPLALNYGGRGDGYNNVHSSDPDSNPNILVMMGTNDGIFHVFENTDSSANESGKEVFGFIPRALLKNFDSIREGQSIYDGMVYGVDGEISSLVLDHDTNGTLGLGYTDEFGTTYPDDKAYVYFGLRRGGKAYYALDVSNPEIDPDDESTIPKLFGNFPITTASTGFEKLGLTFSKPISAVININARIDDVTTTTPTNVLVFGGGYDAGYDESGSPENPEGNAIYIVRADTDNAGELIWKATHSDMVHSIPSEVTLVDSESNGIVDRLYVGDLGGNVWRVDLGETGNTANWFTTKFAALGVDADGNDADRRFFHAPDVVLSKDEFVEDEFGEEFPGLGTPGNFDGVLLATGDRANPLETDATNYLVYIKDRMTVSGDPAVVDRDPIELDDLTNVTDSNTGCIAADTDPDVDPDTVCLESKPVGWYVELEDAGEKGLSSPLVDSGTAIFTSYAPNNSADICAKKEGDGYAYLIDLATGKALGGQQKHDLGPGIPPGAIAISGAVLFPGSGIDVDLKGDPQGGENSRLQKTEGKAHWLIYWREKGFDKL